MQLNEFGPVVAITLTLCPTLILLCVVVGYLARHFRISLLMLAIAQTGWLIVGAYSHYQIWWGHWGDSSLFTLVSSRAIMEVVNYGMTFLNITGMVLLLMEWSTLVREREARQPMM